MKLRGIALIIIFNFSCFIFNFYAQAQGIGFAYLDADRLYDTVPSPFYDDEDYTPGGRLGWNTARYRRKVAQVAGTVDSLGLPFVALWGVENEAVVRDVAAACRGDYVYLHRTLNSLDGMDFALLYYGDVFFPVRVEPGRRYLYIEGLLRRPSNTHSGLLRRPGNTHSGQQAPPPSSPTTLPAASPTTPLPDPAAAMPFGTDTLGIVLCSEARMGEWVVRDLRDERPHRKLLAAGYIPAAVAAKYGLRDATAAAERAGRGNVRRRAGWSMRDRILVDTAFRITQGDVYARPQLLDPVTGAPLATYTRRHYLGGPGGALPVWVCAE